jgi:hypothetical protein
VEEKEGGEIEADFEEVRGGGVDFDGEGVDCEREENEGVVLFSLTFPAFGLTPQGEVNH